MRGSRWFWLASVVLAAAAAALVALLVHRYQRTETVVVARVAVPPWSMVTAGDLGLARRPADGILPGTLLASSVAVGRFTVTGLVPGQAVTAANLSGSGLGSAYDAQLAALDGITRHCKSGTTAIAVPTTGSKTVSGTHVTCGRYEALAVPLDANAGYDLVHAGSRIDLWGTYPTPSGEVAQAIVTGVLVMARFAPGASAPIVGAGGAGPGATATTGIVVLAVTPGQAGRILLAGRLGQLTAVLEPIGGGSGGGSPSPVTLTTLLGGLPAQTVAPASGGVLPATNGSNGG